MLDKVIDALEAVPGVTTFTLTDVRAFGVVAPSGERVREAKKVRIEITAQDALVAQVVAQMVDAAHTGKPGDGGVNVSAIEESVNIRCRE